MTAEEAIFAAFPAEAHRKFRLDLLRLLHAAENAESQIHSVAKVIGYLTDEPAEWIANGVLAESCQETAEQLIVLAARLKVTAMALDKMRSSWAQLRNQGEGDVGR